MHFRISTIFLVSLVMQPVRTNIKISLLSKLLLLFHERNGKNLMGVIFVCELIMSSIEWERATQTICLIWKKHILKLNKFLMLDKSSSSFNIILKWFIVIVRNRKRITHQMTHSTFNTNRWSSITSYTEKKNDKKHPSKTITAPVVDENRRKKDCFIYCCECDPNHRQPN